MCIDQYSAAVGLFWPGSMLCYGNVSAHLYCTVEDADFTQIYSALLATLYITILSRNNTTHSFVQQRALRRSAGFYKHRDQTERDSSALVLLPNAFIDNVFVWGSSGAVTGSKKSVIKCDCGFGQSVFRSMLWRYPCPSSYLCVNSALAIPFVESVSPGPLLHSQTFLV